MGEIFSFIVVEVAGFFRSGNEFMSALRAIENDFQEYRDQLHSNTDVVRPLEIKRHHSGLPKSRSESVSLDNQQWSVDCG